MERRNRSLKALEELVYIDSLDEYKKVPLIAKWVGQHLKEDIEKSFSLELNELEKLSELFYKSINLLKKYRINIKKQLDEKREIKKFFN